MRSRYSPRMWERILMYLSKPTDSFSSTSATPWFLRWTCCAYEYAEVVVGLAATDVGLLGGLHLRAGRRGAERVVEDPDRDQQEVGVGLVDQVLQSRIAGVRQPAEDVGVVLRQKALRLLHVLRIDERVEQMGEVDVDVLVVELLIGHQPRLHPAVEETVDHEVVGRLQIPIRFFQIDVVSRVHGSTPRFGCSPAKRSRILRATCFSRHER